MNFLQRGLAKLAGFPSAVAPPRDIDDVRFWGGGEAPMSLAGQAVTAESALQLDIVQAVLDRLAGVISTLPLMVFERDGEEGRKPARNHPLFRLLHRHPNARQTAQEFRDEQIRHLAFYRNCYCEIVPSADGSPIGSLEPIHPARVLDVKRTPAGILYVVKTLDGQRQENIPEDRIWHIRKAPLTQNGLQGIPVWQTGREVMGRAMAVEEFGSLYFRNGGSGGGVISHPNRFNDKEKQRAFIDSWQAGGTGGNRHRDRLLLDGATYQRFPINNDEAQFIDTIKEMNAKLARLWNMQPHMIGMLERSTNNNIEQQSIEFVVYAIAPWIAAFEQAAARDLLIGDDRDNYFVEFNVSGLLRGDVKTRWANYALARQWGWQSVNDIRRLENMEPLGPEGDVYLQPLNMVPAGEDPEDPAEDAAEGSPAVPAPADA